MHLEPVSSGAEVVVDGPGALPLLLQIYGGLENLVEILKFVLHTFQNFRTDDAVDKAGIYFTGEGIIVMKG